MACEQSAVKLLVSLFPASCAVFEEKKYDSVVYLYLQPALLTNDRAQLTVVCSDVSLRLCSGEGDPGREERRVGGPAEADRVRARQGAEPV